MRPSSQFIPFLQGQVLLDKTTKCWTEQVRYKPRQPRKPDGKKPECLEPCKPMKKSLWKNIFGNKKPPPECFAEDEKPVIECETVEYVTEEQAEEDMKKIAEMGGKVYRTCGTAYILQKDHAEQPQIPESSENDILEEMMKDPSLKGQCDPMGPFKSVELKMIELGERRLHPLYKKIMSIPKRPSSSKKATTATGPAYKTRSGPILPEEFPPHLKINRELFEKKNILYEYKRSEPPQQMLARLLEMKQNERPQLKKIEQKKTQDCTET